MPDKPDGKNPPGGEAKVASQTPAPQAAIAAPSSKPDEVKAVTPKMVKVKTLEGKTIDGKSGTVEVSEASAKFFRESGVCQ